MVVVNLGGSQGEIKTPKCENDGRISEESRFGRNGRPVLLLTWGYGALEVKETGEIADYSHGPLQVC